REQSDPFLGYDARLQLDAAPQQVQGRRKTLGERGLGGEAELLSGSLRIADRDPHLAATRRTAMHDKFCSTKLRHGLRKAPNARGFAGTDIEDKSAGGGCPHRAA